MHKLGLVLCLCTAIYLRAAELEHEIKRAPIELGLSLQLLVPNNISGFDTTLPLIGPHLGFDVGKNTLVLNAFYGSNDRTSTLLLSELDYRWNIYTPFITGWALLGVHYLHFRTNSENHDLLGPVTGLGFYFPMAHGLNMGLGMKIYLPKKTVLSFGGGFVYLL